jgi:hypothetical protein
MKRILEVKKKIGNLSKNSKNPFFKSQYLDLNDLLNAVEPLLQEQGLVLLQPINGGMVWTQIIDSESGSVIADSSIDLPNITDPQKLGSAITYFRRYTLKSLLAIAEKDDDGNKASEPEPKKKPSSKQIDQAKAKYKAGEVDVIDKMKEVFDIDESLIELIKNDSN